MVPSIAEEAPPRPGRRGDPAFLDQEKVMWAWGDVGSRLIEEYR
jgi:hypothetical protein